MYIPAPPPPCLHRCPSLAEVRARSFSGGSGTSPTNQGGSSKRALQLQGRQPGSSAAVPSPTAVSPSGLERGRGRRGGGEGRPLCARKAGVRTSAAPLARRVHRGVPIHERDESVQASQLPCGGLAAPVRGAAFHPAPSSAFENSLNTRNQTQKERGLSGSTSL